MKKSFLKIDCEGAEYEIIPDLDNAGLLNDADVIIMEWHGKSNQSLIDILVKNIFCIYTHNKFSTIGLIIAFKRC